MDVIAFAFGLGAAGFDVFGVVIVLLLLASRVSKRRIVLFASIAFVGTVALGTVAAVLLGESVASLSQIVHRIPAVVWLGLEGVAAVALFGWATYRLCVAPAPDKPPKDSHIARWLARSVVLGGIMYAVSALGDPSFLALIALASRGHSLVTIILAQVVWFVVSQGLFCGLVVAIICGRHQPLIGWFERVRARYSTVFRQIITGAIILCAVILMADAITFVLSRQWLLPS